MLCELWTTADKGEIKDFLKLSLATSSIRKPLGNIARRGDNKW